MSATPGSDPEVDLDTKELDPPGYDGVTHDLKRTFVLAASAAVDSVSVVVPDCSLLVVVASAPVQMRLGAGQALLTVRTLCLGGEDQGGVAVAATTLLFGGGGTLPATVRLYAATTVP